MFHHFYGWQENGTPQGDFARWYGIDQYLFYRVSNTVKLGTRFEWFRDEDGTRVGLMNRPANPNNPPARAPAHPPAHRDAEAHLGPAILRVLALPGALARKRVQDEVAARDRIALPIDALEIGAAREPRAPASYSSRPVHQGTRQTVSRERPLLRRRLIVRLPARVRIRARNPCVRARLRFFGW